MEQSIKVNIGIKTRNTFDFELKNTITGEVKRYKSYNIVLDNFINGIISGGAVISAIRIGTGTGALSETRTNLFNVLASFNLTSVSDANNTEMTMRTAVWSVTLSETQGNGALTEVGLLRGGINGTLVTHSLITDAEGNPISINKTNLDILTIRATVYGQIEFGNSPDITMEHITSTVFNTDTPVGIRSPHVLLEAAARATELPTISVALLGVSRNTMLRSQFSGHVSVPQATTELFINNATMTRNVAERRIRATISRLAASDNLGETYLIKAIRFGNPTNSLTAFYGEMRFPNAGLFPRQTIELNVGVGDGAAVNFNLPFPQCNVGDEEIYVDGVLQARSTYDFNGKNMSYAQAWRSLDSCYLMEHLGPATSGASWLEWWFFPQRFQAQSSTPSGVFLKPFAASPFVYDFGEPVTINRIEGAALWAPVLEYSHDLTTWERAVTQQNNVSFDPITARYWRYWITGDRGLPSGNYATSGTDMVRFDELRDGLIFDTPPPDGAVITAKVTTDYPFKDANWQYGVVVDFYIDRA